MEKYIVIGSIFVLLILLAFLISHCIKRVKKTLTRPINEPLFTRQERDFYGVLCQVSAGRAIVFGKVCVADIPNSLQRSAKKKANKVYKKIARQSFDYVLCDPKNLKVIAFIDFDEKNNRPQKNNKARKSIAAVCAITDIRYARFKLQKKYDLYFIEKQLFTQLKP